MKMQGFFNRFWEIAGAVNVRTKILGMALGLVLLLGTGITLQVRYALTKTLTAQLEEQSVSVGRDLAARSTDLILLNDIFALHRLLQETQLNNGNVRYAFILNSEGQVLAHTFGADFPLALLELNTVQAQEHHHTVVINSNEGLIWDTAVPVMEGRAGFARVGLSDAPIKNTLRNVTNQLILTIILVSFIGVTAATFLTWVLTRPLLDLVRATQAVAQGDFTHHVPRWARDELGDLAEAFNRMVGELGRADELRREKDSLRRQLLEKVIATQEDERRRIARELHDSTSQTLTSLIVGLKVMETTCQDRRIEAQVQELRQVAAQTLDEVHNLAMQLRPRVLDDLGLSAALERLTTEWQARYKVPIDLLIHLSSERLPDEVETALYRIIQEALTNIARHAQARSVSILIEQRGEQVITVVEDDGVGFDLEQVGASADERAHLGLVGLRERAELLGGRLTIESAPQAGTSLFIELPLVVKAEGF